VSYRPICDFWLLARSKVPYYGAYPNGFVERAKSLLGVQRSTPVLHVCGGRAKSYPAWSRLCPCDRTVDLDRRLRPDYVLDVRLSIRDALGVWPAILVDPPYTLEDATHYRPGAKRFPPATALLRNALTAVPVGGRVGFLHYLLPQPSADAAKFIAAAAVITGYNNRIRIYSVFERTE
jgi:hypothetical protein